MSLNNMMKKTAAGDTERAWLFYSHGKGNKDQTFCTIPKSNNPKKTYQYHRRIRKSRNKEYLASCFGWCVCSYTSNRRRLFLWNPVTLEKITLPPLNPWFFGSCSCGYCLLSSPPTEPDCMLMLFAKNRPMILYCWIDDNDEEWTEVNYNAELNWSLQNVYKTNENRPRECLLICPVWCNGYLYAMTSCRRNILVQIHDSSWLFSTPI